MKRWFLPLLVFLAVCLGLFSCKPKTRKNEKLAETPDYKFDEYKKLWIEKLWRMHPEWASSVGYHKYDSVLVIPTPQRRKAVTDTYKLRLAEMTKMDINALSANNQTDFRMMENFMKSSIWQDSVLKIHEWDPSGYNIGNGVADILNGRYDKLSNRLRNISEKLAKAPLYYETAISNLKNPTLEHTRLAILQNKGAAEIFGKTMLDSVAQSELKPAEKELLKQRIQTTRMAVEGYARYLENTLLPKLKKSKNPRSFRIGKENFEQKFQYEIQASNSAEEIYQKALARKQSLHRQMVKLSRELWPKYFTEAAPADSLEMVGKMVSKLSEKHVSRENFVNAVRNQIPELVKFVNEKNLLTQDPTKPLVVRETPVYMRGVAGASVSAPGPYDKHADTYYNVTPLDGYSAKDAESYLREYNNYTLQILNIHEAIPGHYTQLVYSNKAPSIIKAILGNGAMVEGWAVYAEIMMLENGYKNSPEMWLMYNKWNLRVTLNAILDYSVHVLGISEKEAMNLLRKEGFQEEIEAREKWTRAKLSQVQLSSYFTGFTEIYDLREELKKKESKAFDLKKFHEEFLSYGSAPVKYIRQLMLQ